MKKYILILAAIVTTSVVYSQKNKVQTAISYNKAFVRSQKCKELASGVEAINLAIEHDQTKNWAKTWYYRGSLYYNILASNNQECKAIDTNVLEKCTDSYLKALVLNFDDPELKKLDLQKEDGSDMIKFFAALQSKPKVDDEMYMADIMGRKLPGLAGEYANEGNQKFNKNDYKGAQESYGKSMLLGQMGGKTDTVMMYNIALAAEYGEDYDVAKQMYDGLIMLKYNVKGAGPGLYSSMAKIYKKEGNKEKAAEYISKGRKAYSNNNNLLVEELEGFLQSGNHEKALANLNAAITNDDKNHILYFARGIVYENLKQSENAIADYNKALEIKPDYYDANFNLGTYYFNQGVDRIIETNDVPFSETKKFNALKAAAKKAFETAVPYAEKAHELKPGDAETATMLMKLYTHIGETEKAQVIRAKFK